MNSLIAIQPRSSQFLSVCNYITSFGIFLNNLGLIKVDEHNQTVPVLNALFEYLNQFENQSELKIQLLQKLFNETVHYRGENGTVDMNFAEKHYRYIINTALFSHYGYITGYLAQIIDERKNITYLILKQKVLQHLADSFINNDQCSLAKGSSKLSLLTIERIFRDYILPEFTETWTAQSLSKEPEGDFQIRRTKRQPPELDESSETNTIGDNGHYLDIITSISRERGRLDLQSPFSDIGNNAFETRHTSGGIVQHLHDIPSTSRQEFEIMVNNQVDEQMTTRMHTIENASNIMSSSNCSQFNGGKVESLSMLKGYILRLNHLKSNTPYVPTYYKLAQDYCNYGRMALDSYGQWQIINGRHIDDVLFEKKLYVPENLFGSFFEKVGKFGRYIPRTVDEAFQIYKNSLSTFQTKFRFEDFYYVFHGIATGNLIRSNKGDPMRKAILAAIHRLALRQCNEERSVNTKVSLYQVRMFDIDQQKGRQVSDFYFERFSLFSTVDDRNLLRKRQNDSTIVVLFEIELEDNFCGILDLRPIRSNSGVYFISVLDMSFKVNDIELKIFGSNEVILIKLIPQINITKEANMVDIVKALNEILLRGRNVYLDEH